MSIQLYSYLPTTSIMHRMDALSKFFWLLIASTLPFAMWMPWQVVIEIALLFLISVALSNIPVGNVLRSWALFVVLGSLILFFHVTNRHEGELIAKFLFFAIHSDGLEYGLLYGFRVVAILSASYVFVRTTSPRELVVGVISLGVSYRYAWMLFLALVSLPMFEAEYIVVKEAQAVRGIKPASNPFSERIQMYKRYMMPMLATALRRVENLAIAMDSRAFGAYPDRTFIDDFAWSLSGLFLFFSTLVALIVTLILRIRS